tara:strand:+ start:162 stop:365 length:204 start_codon:yes stop_codon:yes gene_type:complete
MSDSETSDSEEIFTEPEINYEQMVIETGVEWAMEFDNYCHDKCLLIGEKMMFNDAINFMKFLFMKPS